MSESGKDTIYIDIDDEITAIIDKLTSSKHKIVALVLPKRATVLQSIVNMKLLKRSGDANNKHLVLITSEAGLLPLAGAVKLHVAKTLQSKPAIPAAPKVPSDDLALEDSETELDQAEDPDIDPKKPVGELAGVAATGALLADDNEPIELDDEPESDTKSGDKESGKKGSKKSDTKSKSDSKIKIPNFNKFRGRLLIGGAIVVALIVLWFVGAFILPSAKITIKTDNISVNTDVDFIASTSAEELKEDTKVVPAVEKQVKKTDADKVTATGKKNIGEKATGTVTVKLTSCEQDSVTIPSGTGVSNGSLTFITQSDATFNSVKIGNQCKNDSFPQFTSGTIKVVAQNPGDQYNISGGRNFTVNGISGVSGVDSSSMSGGTNKEVTVVSDQDVETAKQKLADKSKNSAKSELVKLLKEDNLLAIGESLTALAPSVVAAPKVGDEASEVTVTSITTYSMLGVKQEDLKKLVVGSAKEQIDTDKQKISDDGLSKAIYKMGERKTPTDIKINVQSTVSTGTQVDQDALKKEIAGKKKGEVQQIVGALPGVKEVNVKYSPFWVYKTPSKPAKITLVFEQANNAEQN
jgi:hypothetical protein